MFDKKMMRLLAISFAAVSQVITYSLAGFVLGYGLEIKFVSLKPFASIILTFLGLTLGFRQMYQIYKTNIKNDEN